MAGTLELEPCVAGIDPGLSHLGLCVITQSGQTQSSHKRSAPVKDHDDPTQRVARYNVLVHSVFEFLDCWRPSLVLVEAHPLLGGKARDSSFGRRDRDELMGILYADLAGTSYVRRVIEVYPSTLKKFITNDGRADKSAIVGALIKKWGVSFGSEHEFESFALAKMACTLLGWEEQITKRQRECLRKIDPSFSLCDGQVLLPF